MHGLLALDFRNEILQHGCHIANDRHIRLTVLADFRRIDINVNHTCTRSESVKLAGYTIVETSADRNKQIATLHGTGSGNRAMHAKHAKHLRIGIRHNTACGQRGDDRSVRDFRQLLHELAGIGTCRAAAHIQHRTVRLLEQLRSVGKHTAVRLRGGVVAGQNHALRPRIVHIAGLCGFGDVDHHRTRAAGTCHIVRFSQHTRNVLRTRDQIGVLDHRVGCADDIGFLEGVGANGVHADLAGDDHHRHGIHVRVGDRGDHVRGARAGRDDAHADLTSRYGIAFSRMTCGLFVAHQHKTEAGFIIDCIVYRQNRAAWNAENILDAQIFQRTYQRFGAGHLLAVNNGLLFSGCGCLGHAAECLQGRR